MEDPRAKRAAEIQDSVQQILFRHWDPLGVSGALYPQDEYGAYIEPVYRILVGSRSEQELVGFLSRTEVELMSLQGGSPQRLRAVARRLLELDVTL